MADILTLAEAKAFMPEYVASTAKDALLETYIDALTAVAKHHLGPVVAEEVIEEIPASTTGPLFLRYPNVVSITSLTEYASGTGTVLTAEDYDTEGTYQLRHGMLYRRSGWADTRWTSGTTIRVVYQAGYTGDDLATIKLGAKRLLKHWWGLDQGSASQTFGEPVDTTPGDFTDLPNSVQNVWRPYLRGPMVA